MSESTITLPVRVPRREFWQAVVGSAWETWDWWGNSVSEAAYQDEYTRLTVKAWPPNREGGGWSYTKTVTVEELASAYTKAIEGNFRDTCTGNPLDWQNLDACGGDIIFQLAVYGQVIWS